MKLENLFEAAVDYTATVQELKKSKEFEKLLENFIYKSTKTQEKNGNLYFETKPELMKRAKEYKLGANGEVAQKNNDAGIWGKVNEYKSVGIKDEAHRLLMWKGRMDDIYQHFLQWAAKRMKSKTDYANRNATSLAPFLIPEEWKGETFNCSDNLLTDLVGGPLGYVKWYYAADNDLVSPIVGAPEECYVFSVQTNKLTNFEGCPPKCHSLAINRNPISAISGISKVFTFLHLLHIDHIEHVGYLDLFKIKEFIDLRVYDKISHNKIDDDWVKIINRHLRVEDRDLLECKEALMSAGFKEYAKI